MIENSGHGHDIKPGSERSFGLVFAGFFAALAVYGALVGRPAVWLFTGLAICFVIVALVRPAILAPLNRAWFRLGMLLARLIQPLVVGAVFFLVVTPIGLLLRALGKDVLRMRYDPAAESYWIKRDPPGPAPNTMDRQF